MSYTPYNESPRPPARSTAQDGSDITEIIGFMQGDEIRDPVNLRRRIIPRISTRAPRITNDGFVDNSLEVCDLGQDIKASTGPFVDTTEKFTPKQIIDNNIAATFLNQLITQDLIDETNDGVISVFSPNGLEVPYSVRGISGGVFSSNSFVGYQQVSSAYQNIFSLDEFLDGQEVVLNVAAPPIQSINDVINLPYDDANHDDTDRFGINILNQNIDLYDLSAACGFVYENNVRDSIAFGGLKG